MKNLTRKDYEKEIVRFCQILTQQKYDKNDDKMIKKMISENLEHVSFDVDFQDSEKISKKAQTNRILRLSSAMVNFEYGTKEDRETKEELCASLGQLSRCVENARQARADTRATNELKKMISCF